MSQYDHHAQQGFKDMLYLDGLFLFVYRGGVVITYYA